jgi:hypothetical protein
MKTVAGILTEHLKAIGADGLCYPSEECGCGIDELIVCGWNFGDCVPARRVVAPEGHESEGEEIYVPMEAPAGAGKEKNDE